MALNSQLGTENATLANSLTPGQPTTSVINVSASNTIAFSQATVRTVSNLIQELTQTITLGSAATGVVDLQPPLEALVIVGGIVQQGGNAVIYGGRRKSRDITAPTLLSLLDEIVMCSEGPYTVTVPTAANVQGKIYWIKNRTAGIITVAPTGDETIDGELFIELEEKEAITIASYDEEWHIL